ncbi:putative glycogen debranching enzyme [Krasilnikovia cinnamomea]|uniref:Putative glycogen debranching enzyme n=1 Tax=Krasilnikovia cinnamomea TaxID=349313 RepID=A0A4Q7ZEI3_9ACTN|nr:glycogen debranching enzyme N-terminal domain-containing protein [Krasilnikovia cinnamomea]RZU49078.1 putative glycogen debranching enzyme [Krasilnikovia cinnamomea]
MIPPIRFGPQVCASLADTAGAGREWLVVDGLGGFAAGTVAGLRTRREHALLTVADPAGGTGRVGLAALDLTVTLPSGTAVPLFSHEWASGAVSPAGHRHLETFTLADGLPRWRWRVGEVVVERELAMARGQPGLAVVHRVVAAPEPVSLAVAAMCGAHYSRVEQVADGAVVADAFRLAGPGWQPGGTWHLGARTRADGAVEDLWFAGTFLERVTPGGVMEISAWAGELTRRPPPAGTVVAAARQRARRLVTAAGDGYAGALALAADAFVIHGPGGPDVVAGYPWTGHHPGDTMTAYEGLLLDGGRADEGRDLLTVRTRAAVRAARAAHPAEPDIPAPRASAPSPGVPSPGAPHSGPAHSGAAHSGAANSGAPHAPLWLVHAVDRHVHRIGDTDLAAELGTPLGRLLRAHLDGSGPLHVDPGDQLLRVSPGTGHTPADQAAVAPRTGKTVEINALWVNALAALAGLYDLAGRDSTELRARHARAHASFAARFPAPEGWLYDVVDGPAAAYPLGGAHHDDPTLRPHQLLAWSLPYGPLAGADGKGAAAVRSIGDALLTPLGLRTLAPTEYGYQADTAHQGRVRPWLIGPYADACAATGRPTEGLLSGLEAHMHEHGIGSVSESADGDAPHRATGRPFSARAVAEALRVRERCR